MTLKFFRKDQIIRPEKAAQSHFNHSQPENTSKPTANSTSFHPSFHKHTYNLQRFFLPPTQTCIYV